MRRRRPQGATDRPDLEQRRFERRLNDLRGDYLAIHASPAFIARIQASLHQPVNTPPRHRKALSFSATLACAFLGGFLLGGTPRDVPTRVVTGRVMARPDHQLLIPATPRAAPSWGAPLRVEPRSSAAEPGENPLPNWARGLLRTDPDPRVRAAGTALEGVLSTSP